MEKSEMPSLDRVETFRNNAASKFLRLSEVLPLRSPLFMLIDPTNLCNFRCRFCPTGDPELLKSIERPVGRMGFGIYRRLVDGISEFEDRLRVLSLYKDGEPLLNRELGRMITYAKRREVTDTVQVATNAALLTRERSVELIESGLDQIRISVEHVNDQGYEKITRTKVEYGLIRSNVEFLFNEKERRNSPMKIHAKIIDTDLTEWEKKSFIRDFSTISDTINIDSLMGWSCSDLGDFTLGLDPAVSMNQTHPLNKDIVVCPLPFITMAVNFNGSVSVCCVDWSHGTVIGDGTRETLRQIWNGKEFHALRRDHLRGNRKSIGPCGNCQYIEGTDGMSNIDHCAESLLECYPE
jgi:uncharacterized Fe-S cluster-containing radical SAM superfamily protein